MATTTMNNSLVSVIIATYNSSSFVREALESVNRQTWKEIELIICDDCSQDDTVEICRNWVNDQNERFVRIELIASEINTGVSENLNRGLRNAHGDWIKGLAGDDILLPDCIENNMAFIEKNSEIRVLFSKANVYFESFEESNYISTTPGEIDQNSILWPKRTVESQYRLLLLSDRIHFSPASFISRETLLFVGAYDLKYKQLEDYPLWLNLTKSGHKLFFLDVATVCYRQHSKALNNTGISYLINPNYFKQEDFRKEYTYPYLPTDLLLLQRYRWFASQVFRLSGFNKDILTNRLLLNLLVNYLNPFKYYIWLRKRLKADLKNNDFYK